MAAAAQTRRATGRIVRRDLRAAPTTVYLGGRIVRNWAYGGTVPGLSQEEVAPAGSFDYEFVVPHPGTYWFHPHVGVQLDTGLQAPLIVEDPAEPG